MPKVSKTQLNYDGESRWYDIHYKGGEGFSIKGLPREFCSLANFGTIDYLTEGALITAALEACKLYRLRKTQSKLVIMYRCKASAELVMNKLNDNHYSGRLPGVSQRIESTLHNGLATIDIDFVIAQIIDDGAKPEYRRVNQDTLEASAFSHTFGREYLQMDYTPERHEFFKQIVVAMRQMVVGISNFFGAEPEDAVKFIDNKIKLLN